MVEWSDGDVIGGSDSEGDSEGDGDLARHTIRKLETDQRRCNSHGCSNVSPPPSSIRLVAGAWLASQK